MGRSKTSLKRINFYLTEFQIKELMSEAKKAGLTFSEILRRIVDVHLAKKRGS